MRFSIYCIAKQSGVLTCGSDLPEPSLHTWRILHECSCFIEFIKQVGEERYNARFAELINSNNTRAYMVDSIYHMTLRLL